MNPIETASQLSHAGDRTMFIAAIIVLVGGGLLGIRTMYNYFLREHERLTERIMTLDEERKGEHAVFVQTVTASTEAIKENSQVIGHNTEALLLVKERLKSTA